MAMVQYQPTIHTTAQRELQALEDSDRERLTSIISDVAEYEEPTSHEKVRAMAGQEGLFRIRAGGARAVLTLQKPELRVLSVGYRDNVYDCIDSINERRASV